MTRRTSPWPAGMPCWTDLTTPDVAAASDFYTAVLGWEVQETSEEYGGYVMAQVAGGSVAGIGPRPEEAPTVWRLYFASDDVDATAAAVVDHGGTVIVDPRDIGPVGRICVAADPAGGVFGVWQHGENIGAEVVNEPGALMWEDLRSTDPDAARTFYAAVFGHRMVPMPDAGPDYALFHLGDDDMPLGGIGGPMGAPEGTPSHWLVYFCVSDADAAIAAAERGGGSALGPAFDTPYGRMAGISDPWGAVFWITQAPEGSEQPDRSG